MKNMGLFDGEPDRLEAFSAELCGIFFDFSKAALSGAELEAARRAAALSPLPKERERLFSGAVVNPSEGRAATHVAERGSGAPATVAVAERNHQASRDLAARIRGGDFGPVRHVLHLGIGGSALGPALLVDALGRDSAIEVAVVSNVDGAALEPVLDRFDPAATLILAASKTFTTVETITNLRSALGWIGSHVDVNPLSRCVALTAAPERAHAFGINPRNILQFAETVGGRYSIWSSIGLPAALALGYDRFDELRAGAAAMDRHFQDAPVESNVPLLAALIDVHYMRVAGFPTRAVFAYDDRLKLLPFYLQQLEMESNGKCVRADGSPLEGNSAPITWGGVGTDGQHAVFQLLHQGTHVSPVEFVAVREPGHGLDPTHHRQLLSNCFAQGAALMRGRGFEEALVLTHGDEALARAKTFPGGRPSATLLLDRLDAFTLGALLAFYEHRTFAAAVLLGINPFDQWGVELGKEIATAVAAGRMQDLDPSTRALLERAGL